MSIFKRKHKVAGKVRMASVYSLDFRDHAGIVHRLPAFRDKAASEELERNVRRLVGLRVGGAVPDVEASRFLESCPAHVRDALARWSIVATERAEGRWPRILPTGGRH